MFCKNCGKNIPDDSKFCPECGKEILGDVRTTDDPILEEDRGREDFVKEEPVLEERRAEEDFGGGKGQGNTGSKSLGSGLGTLINALSEIILPLQRWLYDKGPGGKWMIIGFMVVISILPMLLLPSTIGSFLIPFAVIFILISIFIQYILSKIPLSHALKQIKVVVPIQKFRVNVLLLMAFGQVLSLFTSFQRIKTITNFSTSFKNMGLFGSLISLIITTIMACALFWKDMKDEEDILPFSGHYILMRFIVSFVLGILSILVLAVLAKVIMNSMNSYFY